MRARDRRWEGKKRTKKEEKRWCLPWFCTTWSFPSSLWIMANSLSQLAWCIHSTAHCLSAINAWFSLSISIWNYQSLAPSSAQNVESFPVHLFRTGIKATAGNSNNLDFQNILVIFYDTFYCVWDRVLKVLSLCDAFFFKHIWPPYDYDLLSLVQI